MTNVGKFAYDTLKGSTALTALVSTDSILPTRPEIIVLFPSVYFSDEQRDCEFVDNLPAGDNADITIDVYIRDDSPYAITKVICDLMKGLYWACTTNIDAPDPDTAVRHRHLTFTRPLMSGDI
jgi:hypothetical protein